MNATTAVPSSTYQLNQQVTTPLGVGNYQAPFAVVDASGATIVVGLMVRLPINAVTAKSLKMSNCLTPTAQINGLWVFQAHEVQA